VFSEILNVEKYTLKSGPEVTQGHERWYHSMDRVWFLFSVL